MKTLFVAVVAIAAEIALDAAEATAALGVEITAVTTMEPEAMLSLMSLAVTPATEASWIL